MHEHARIAVVFSGGGTGGHLYPALALADALVALRPDVRPFFVGASRGVEARILPERGLEYLLLPVEGFRRGGGALGVDRFRALPRLGLSLLRVADLVRSLRPEAVVVTGGYAGGPAGIVAGLQGIPLVLQEQNAVPGATTRLLARWARRVHVAFPEVLPLLPARARARAVVSGNPVRPNPDLDKAYARALFSIPERAALVLVVGGSQGSRALNRTVLEAVRAVVSGALTRPEALHLLWSTGPSHFDEISQDLEALGAPAWVHATSYIADMPAALSSADLAVSRAGAMATAELLNHGIPAILVPLPSAAADHQAGNARALAEAGAAVVVSEAGLTGGALWSHVGRLAGDAELRMRMASAARERARPSAAIEIARDIASLLPSAAPRGTR